MTGLPTGAEPREQLWSLWQHWMNWAVSYPEKRRALAQLGVSDEITPETRAAGHKTMAGVAGLLEQIRASGPMRKAPMGFVGAIMNSVAEATIDSHSVNGSRTVIPHSYKFSPGPSVTRSVTTPRNKAFPAWR